MLVFCYHNGAMGHATMALIECCTREGNRDWPEIYPGKNLHHFHPRSGLFTVKHPHCDVAQEQQCGNVVLASGSRSVFGRFLIVLMGLAKWTGQIPDFDAPAVYKQQGESFGKQLEILSLTLKNKVSSDQDWFIDADCYLDILDYWNDVSAVEQWLIQCGFTPVTDKIMAFCQTIRQSNAVFYQKVLACYHTVDHVMTKHQCAIDLDFWQLAVCHAVLLDHFRLDHRHVKLLHKHPTSTNDLIEIYNV